MDGDPRAQHVDLDAIRAAAQVVTATAKRTPIVPSVSLSEHRGGNILLKAESLQVTGSFKIRGALTKVASLLAPSGSVAPASRPADGAVRATGVEAVRAAGTVEDVTEVNGVEGVTSASAGNHAQALAYAARRAGLACEIFVPIGAAITKIEASQALGATVIEAGATLDEAMRRARDRAGEAGYAFCHPFDDPTVVAGQGTLGLELHDDVDDLRTVIVPLGGGGLAAGTAIAVKSLDPRVRVVAVQADACAPYAGGSVADGPITTLADGIAVKHPGAITGPLIERWVDEVVTVGEDAIADAMVLLMDRAKLYVEGAGAVGVAALLDGAITPSPDGVTCVVLSGGNVDLGVVPGLIRRHETQAGRRLVVFAKIPDRPGGLANLLAVFADAGANLIEVEHLREGVALHVRETEVHCTFEVRSREHAAATIAAARDAGYHDLRVDSPDRP